MNRGASKGAAKAAAQRPASRSKKGQKSIAKRRSRHGAHPAETKQGTLRGVAVLAVLGCLSISGLVRLLPKTDAVVATRSSAGMAGLEAALATLCKAWRPEDHARALAIVTERAGAYIGPLRQLLLHPEHPMIVPALQLAGHLRLEAALPDVMRLAGRTSLRIPALTAADAIAPLPEADLLVLLGDAEPAMVVAALGMAKRREEPPLRAMVGLLAHENDRIAAAALANLPAQLPEQLRGDLENLTYDARQAVRTRAWQVLLRIDAEVATAPAAGPEVAPDDANVEATSAPDRTDAPDARADLLQRLDAGDDETRIAALQELSAHAQPEDGERVAAFLQRSEPEAVQKEVCLFLGRVQYRPAVREMIDLMRDTGDAGLKANAHWSLQRITGLQLKLDPNLWEQWWQRSGGNPAAPR